MKKIKSFVVLLIVLAMSMSILAACRPADEDDISIDGGGTTTTGGDDNGNNTNNEGNGNGDNGNTNNNGDNGNTNNNGGGTNNNGGGTGNNNNNNNNNKTNNAGDINTKPTSENPLIAKNKKINRGAAVSYNLDNTGFVKNVKLADLKGKTLTLYTAVDYGIFSYYNDSEKVINEWAWFKELKKLYGVTVKYVRCAPGGSNVVKPFQAMSAGKDIDLITTHVSSFPYICNILEPLDSYVNMANFANSVGLDPQITNLTKWKGKHIILGPACSAGRLVYNKTYLKNVGVDDPYTLFKAGKWNWTNFKKYMNSLPATTSSGQKLIGMSTWSQYWYWANTNAKACFEIDGNDANGGIINNMGSAEVKETYTWLESVCKSSKCTYFDGNGGQYFWGTKKDYYSVMNYGYSPTNIRGILEDYNKKNEYGWVPFPKNEKNSKAINHVEVYGFGIGIPRKTNKPANRAAAVKFCELWANRFAEAQFDGYVYKEKMSHDKVVEFYEFTRTNSRFGLGSGVGSLAKYAANSSVGTKFNLSITDSSYSTASCLEKLQNYAKQEVANVLKFGVQ